MRKTKLEKIDNEIAQCGNDMLKFQELITMKANIAKLHISLGNG